MAGLVECMVWRRYVSCSATIHPNLLRRHSPPRHCACSAGWPAPPRWLAAHRPPRAPLQVGSCKAGGQERGGGGRRALSCAAGRGRGLLQRRVCRPWASCTAASGRSRWAQGTPPDSRSPHRARTCVPAAHKEAHGRSLLIKGCRRHQLDVRQHCAAGLAGRHSRHHIKLDGCRAALGAQALCSLHACCLPACRASGKGGAAGGRVAAAGGSTDWRRAAPLRL